MLVHLHSCPFSGNVLVLFYMVRGTSSLRSSYQVPKIGRCASGFSRHFEVSFLAVGVPTLWFDTVQYGAEYSYSAVDDKSCVQIAHMYAYVTCKSCTKIIRHVYIYISKTNLYLKDLRFLFPNKIRPARFQDFDGRRCHSDHHDASWCRDPERSLTYIGWSQLVSYTLFYN